MIDSSLPTNAQELRSLLLDMMYGRSHIQLGEKSRKALAQILDLQKDPALLSITSLAKKLEVSPSTITRLAKRIGYSGFGAFQEVILSNSLSSQFYSQHAKTALDGSYRPSSTLVDRLSLESKGNIDSFTENLSSESFDQAIEMISSSSKVYVYGIRQFHAFASFLTYGLRLIRSDVNILDANALGVAEELSTLGEKDLLICASCEPYSTQVVSVAKAAKEYGIPVLAISDSFASPLVSHSQLSLLVPHDTSFISNSITVFMLLAECLINGCAAATSEESRIELGRRETMIRILKIEV